MRFAEFLIVEASYVDNIGMMEMFKFYQIATSEEKDRMKKFLSSGEQEAAWEFLKKITGIKLK